MAEYRTLKRSFWNDPFIEELAPAGKLLYVYLLTCPHTSNLGLLEVARRRLAYETGLEEETVASLLAHMESQGKIVTDGNRIWLVKFIRHQASTSPRLLQSLRRLFAQLNSLPLRKAICQAYPDIFGALDTAPFPAERIEIPTGWPHADPAGMSGSASTGWLPTDPAGTPPPERAAAAVAAITAKTDSQRTPDTLSRPLRSSLPRENAPPCAYPMHTLSIPCQEKEGEQEKEKEYLSPLYPSQGTGGYTRAQEGHGTARAADRQAFSVEQGKAGQPQQAAEVLMHEKADDRRAFPSGEAPRQKFASALSGASAPMDTARAADRQVFSVGQGKAGQPQQAAEVLMHEKADDRRAFPSGEAPRQKFASALSGASAPMDTARAADRQAFSVEQGKAGQTQQAAEVLMHEKADDRRAFPSGEAPRQKFASALSGASAPTDTARAADRQVFSVEQGKAGQTQQAAEVLMHEKADDRRAFPSGEAPRQKFASALSGASAPTDTEGSIADVCPDAGKRASPVIGSLEGQAWFQRRYAPPHPSPMTGRAEGQMPVVRAKQPGAARKLSQARARPAGYAAGTPRLDFVELREFYTREIRPEGELDGYAEFCQLVASGRQPGIHRLMDDLAARKAAGVWNAGYEIGLARYLKTHGWTAPLRPAGARRANATGRLLSGQDEPHAMTEYQKQRQDRRKLAAFLLAERGGSPYGATAYSSNTTVDGQATCIAGGTLQYQALPGRTGTAG